LREGEEEGGNVTEELEQVAKDLANQLALSRALREKEAGLIAALKDIRAQLKPLDRDILDKRRRLWRIEPPKPEKPKRGRPKGSRNKKIVEKSAGDTKDTTPANISFPDEAELRKQAICRNPSTGQGCGKLLSQCVCGADITLPKKEDEGA
jgi:hypothetical protein